MDKFAYTVVIPAYNAEKYLAETIDSVLAQTASPEAVIVVNDGSTDNTVEVAQAMGDRVRVISTPNRGGGPATTTGIEQVTTPIVATVDSDDLWRPTKMRRQLDILENPELGIDAVLTRLEPFGQINEKTAETENSGWSRSTLAMRTDVFRRVGPIEPLGTGYSEMIDWFARAREAGIAFHMIEDPLADRRIHSESLSFRASQNRDRDYLQAAVRAIQRKRQSRQ